MIKPGKLLINIALWGFILIIMAIFFRAYKSELIMALSHIQLQTFIIVMILQIPLLALGGYPFKLFCLPFKIDIKALDWVGLTYISNSLNHLLPYRPGLGVRYLYLRKHYQIQNSQFV